MSDIGAVPSYATVGLREWADPKSPHGAQHDGLLCGDVRRYLQHPPLRGASMPPVALYKERAS